ncbi:hypothetical protein BGX23_010584 [Mortierella sp. AD031]|nr:hypothetical protein BGX23_010584 [Mortierella sp. AD031]
MTQKEHNQKKQDGPVVASSPTALPVRGNTYPLDPSAQELRKLKQARRQQAAPPKPPVPLRHLDEFMARKNDSSNFHPDTKHHHHPQQQQPEKPLMGDQKDDTPPTETTPLDPQSSSPPKKQHTKRLKEPLSIRPMSLKDFLMDGLRLYISNIKHPEQIPGTDWFSRVYAMGLLPVLVISMAIVQGGIGLLISLITHTAIGARLYKKFFDNEIALFDDSDYIDPEGRDEAIRQLADREPRESTHFSYHVATLLLIMSSMAYQRDEKLVAEASKILLDVTTNRQKERAAELLQQSEREIDEHATKEFGMRFMGISELKTLGGPFAGLFYDDDSIVLVFKGTSVLAFNEYLIDVTIQRVDASEYLYSEVHKGFYECLFPDAKPEMYDNQTYDRTNPFNTIMETIFEVAKAAKEKTGKPVNLWLTGHSLGGALAALVMARLQMPLQEDDPLWRKEEDEENEYDEHGHRIWPEQRLVTSATATTTNGQGEGAGEAHDQRTVLAEMLARYSDDQELITLRDCYSVASPKLGDARFAEEFARHQLRFCQASSQKSVYWRIVANEDIIPHMPPGCSTDPHAPTDRLFPPPCIHCCKTPQEWLEEEQREDSQAGVKPGCHTVKETPPKHLHSLLDYQHIGQLIKVYNAKRIPQVRPSAFEADLCQGVLRKKDEVKALLGKLGKVAGAWRSQSAQALKEYTQAHSTTEGAGATPEQQQDAALTTGTTDIKKKDAEDKAVASVLEKANAAQQITDDVAKAQELYDIDELSRLRQPGPIQSLLLKIPSLLSHAPATYQRDLVRGRFYFASFPGHQFEKRVTLWLDQAQAAQEEEESKADAQLEKENDVEVEKEVEVTGIKASDSGHVSTDEDEGLRETDANTNAKNNGRAEARSEVATPLVTI